LYNSEIKEKIIEEIRKMDINIFIDEEQYIQCRPLGVDGFIAYCKERGLSVDKSKLEYFEKKKLFFPILRIKRPKYKEKIERISENEIRHLGPLKQKERYNGEIRNQYAFLYYEKSYLTILKKKNYISVPKIKRFVPWKKYIDPISGEETHLAFYSQFQIFWLNELLQASKIELTLPFFDKLPQNLRNLRLMKTYSKSIEKAFIYKTDDFYQIVEILIAIQNRYLPYTKSDQRSILVSYPAEYLQWNWQEFKKNWNPERILQSLNIDLNRLNDIYRRIESCARYIDPLEHWNPLMEFISYEKKQKLKGQALLALDFYGMSKMLKMFYEDLTGEKSENRGDRNNWKVTYYGVGTLANKTELLEYLTNEYHLNPRPKLILVVEGDGEYENIPKIAEAMGLDLNTSSIKMENLQGIGEFKKLSRFIDHYHNLQTVVFVLLDNENRSRQFKQRIVESKSKFGINRKITKTDYIKIWDKNYEYDNFSDEEIASAMSYQSREKYFFRGEEINCARLGKSKLQDLFRSKVGYDLNKKDLAVCLSNIIIKEIEQGVAVEKIKKKRKIVSEIINITEIAIHNPFPVRKDIWKNNQESGYFGDKIE
jgi:hypothetical protein